MDGGWGPSGIGLGAAHRSWRVAPWCIALVFACGCSAYDNGLLQDRDHNVDPLTPNDAGPTPGASDAGGTVTGQPNDAGDDADTPPSSTPDTDSSVPIEPTFDPLSCADGVCWWSNTDPDACQTAGAPTPEDRPDSVFDGDEVQDDIYLGWTRIRLGSSLPDGSASNTAWEGFGLDLDGICTNSSTCPDEEGAVSCQSLAAQIPYDGELCRDNTFASLQPIAAQVPEIGETFGISEDVFNCALWHGSYNIVTRVSGYNGRANDSQVRVDFYVSDGLERPQPWSCPFADFSDTYPLWRASQTWHIDDSTLDTDNPGEGALPYSHLADPDAYVKFNYLVARLPDGALLRLAGDGMPYRGFPLRVEQGLWVGHLQKKQDGTWTMRDGLATGRTRKENLILGFRQVGFCPGMGLDPFYDAMVNYVEENADVLASGEVDAEAQCDAISVGIAFEASQLTPGATGPIEPMVECCPPGDSIAQCQAVCGDGAVTGNEGCDTGIAAGEPGACPPDCLPLDPCTPQVAVGEGCAAHCEPTPITAFVNGDECCPPSADETEDADCPSVCDNGVVELGETCDPVASCPTSCTSTNACLTARTSGSAALCTAACDPVPVTACNDGDGCCASGCTQANDDDCSTTCGDGFIDMNAGETCEAGSATPCPASCNDSVGCTRDVRTGSAANCNVVCSHPAITQPLNGDGCCPGGANANNDNDCTQVCGNGAREGTELCDGDCPTACNDNVACTADAVTGTACNRRCNSTPITQPANGDGCCPPGGAAYATNDNDCPTICGNGHVEPGELCDDSNTRSNDGCSSTCQVEANQAMCLSLLPTNDTCTQCSCLDCRSASVACYGSADATGNAQCAALIACGRANDCTGTDCYCGTADLFTCLFGGGNGRCRSQVEAAARTLSPIDIQARSADTNYPLGRANALASCAVVNCASECGL